MQIRINSISTMNDIRSNRVILYFLKKEEKMEEDKLQHCSSFLSRSVEILTRRKIFATDSC